MRKRILIFAAAALAAISVQAKVRLPHVLSDGMIIQQNTEAHLWGWAKAKSDVTVTASWTTDKFHTTADKNGRFLVSVKTPAASFTPLTITIDDGYYPRCPCRRCLDLCRAEQYGNAGQGIRQLPCRGLQ